MGKVISHMTMSLDGFVADPHDRVDELFGWYEGGAVTVPSAGERWSFKVGERSAQMLREVMAATGALVCGRRLFDHTDGGGDRPPRHLLALCRIADRRRALPSFNVSTIRRSPGYAAAHDRSAPAPLTAAPCAVG